MKNLKTLNRYLKKYAKSYLLGFLFVGLGNFLAIFAIRYVSEAFDEIKLGDNLSSSDSDEIFKQILYYTLIYIVLNIFSGVLKFSQRQTLIVASRKIEFDLRKDIFKHYTLLPLKFYKDNRIGDLMNRITEDVSNVRMYLGPGIMYLVNLATILLIIPPFMFYYDWKLALIALLPLPILSLIIYWVTRTIYKKSMEVQKYQSKVSSFVQDTFSGIRVVKSFVKESFTFNKYDELTEDYRLSNLSLAKTNALFFPTVALIIGLNYVLVVFMGGVRYMEGFISIGNIAAFFLYINYLVWPFISLGWIVSLIQKAEVSMERINEFMEEETEKDIAYIEKITLVDGDIEFRNVSYTYPNTGILALNNISFKVEKGENLAIFGKTGSGKTTIALLLLGLIEPDEGNIFIGGLNLSDISLNQIRASMGYIPQDSFLFSDTIESNIAYGKNQYTAEEVVEYAKKADVHNNIQAFENKYETELGERGVTLSGGQKQRVSIARALLKQAPILIFDDALSAVDTETEENILQNIESEFNDRTLFIITHRISSAKNADAILYLEEGEIEEYGNAVDLLEKRGKFFELYEKQNLEKEL